MITKSNSYKTEDGQLFATQNEAKLHELDLALLNAGVSPDRVKTIIDALESHIDLAIEILTGSVRVMGKYNRKPKATPATTDKTKP